MIGMGELMMVESSFGNYDRYLQGKTMTYLFWQRGKTVSNTIQYNDKSSFLEYTKEQRQMIALVLPIEQTLG